MTKPQLSLETTQLIGRVYQHPKGGYSSKLNTEQTLAGLNTGKLMPSITNCINVFNKKLEGYATYMMRLELQEALAEGVSLTMRDIYTSTTRYIRHRDQAAERGTRVHKFIEDFIDAGYAKMTTEQLRHFTPYTDLEAYDAILENHDKTGDLGYVDAFFSFFYDHRPDFTHQEVTVYGATNDQLMYAGTTDFIATVNGKTVVGDWKTSKTMSLTVAHQLAAVVYADRFTSDFKTTEPMMTLDAAYGIQLRQNGSYGLSRVTDVERAWTEFQAMRRLWDTYAFPNYNDNLIQLTEELS